MPTARNTASTKSSATPKKSANVKIDTADTPRTTRRAAAPKAQPTANPIEAARTQAVEPEQRRQYVEVAAYFIAERRGFGNGDEADDWFAAEAEIDRLIGED